MMYFIRMIENPFKRKPKTVETSLAEFFERIGGGDNVKGN